MSPAESGHDPTVRIAYVLSDVDAPGCYRCLFPARQLEKRGHTTLHPPHKKHKLPNDRLRIEYSIKLDPPTPEADIWVLQQRNERMWIEFGIRMLRHHGVVSVAEVDDLYLNLPKYSPAYIGSSPWRKPGGTLYSVKERKWACKNPEKFLARHPHIQGEAKERLLRDLRKGKFPKNEQNRDHMHDGFRLVDAMTVSTPFLKQAYAEYNPNIRVIRNYLDWEMWDDLTPAYEQTRPRKRIGYMGVFKYREGDLRVVRKAIERFMLDHPDIDFVANSKETHDYLGVPPAQRITYPEVSFRDLTLPTITNVMDVGIVPLALNDLNQAKSHLKGMEYNACGIPFIASPTESYRDYWCDEGRNGLLAHSEDAWYDLLELLCRDDELRHEMGIYGREKASQNTIQEHVGEWEAFYEELLGGEAQHVARAAIANGAIQKATELAPLLELLQERQPRTIVEIGSARGGTFYAFCQVAADDALLVSIDLPGGDFGGTELDQWTRTGRDKYGARNIAKMRGHLRADQSAEFIQADSQLKRTRHQLVRALQGRQIDFLMIDGDHAYEGVRADHELYQDLVAEDGIIAFHDILPHPREPRTQVHRYWDEIKGKHTTLEFTNPREDWGWGQWGGLGVVFK